VIGAAMQQYIEPADSSEIITASNATKTDRRKNPHLGAAEGCNAAGQNPVFVAALHLNIMDAE
jgi:hypothetical protein